MSHARPRRRRRADSMPHDVQQRLFEEVVARRGEAIKVSPATFLHVPTKHLRRAKYLLWGAAFRRSTHQMPGEKRDQSRLRIVSAFCQKAVLLPGVVMDFGIAA